MRRRAARRASWKFGFSQETSPSVFHRSYFLSPSASQKKSPADVVEGMEEFLRSDAGGAEFADDDAGGVREHGGVRERCACGGSERESAENRVAGAGHVKDLAAGGAALDAGLADARVGDFKTRRGNVEMTGRRFFKDAHSLFTAGDDHGAAAEMREQGAACFLDGFFVGEGTRDVEAGFFCVADDGARAAIGVEARRFRLYENGNFQLMRGAEDAVGEVVGDETFVVVGKHERVEMPECGEKQT